MKNIDETSISPLLSEEDGGKLRYFIEVSYKGTAYAGFQIQRNANTIQAEVEKALNIILPSTLLCSSSLSKKMPSTFLLPLEKVPKANEVGEGRGEVAGVSLTGSSRTDAGVHALQNFFHFELENPLNEIDWDKIVYSLNAILPLDIVVKRVFAVNPHAHCRFDAISRTYKYTVYHTKNPFLQDRGYYYPYKIDIELMQQASALLMSYTNFKSFSKQNTQVKTFECNIIKSRWSITDDCFIYEVTANRFLRGMVRGLVGTMLKVGNKKMALDQFKNIIESQNAIHTDFSVPPQGLSLIQVKF